MQGKIHSIQTLGTVDGPGIRFVLFLQGCPLRCLYCHNPDALDLNSYAFTKTSNELLEEYEKNKEFCKGGITVTGGEPLMQIDFLIDFFKKAKKKNIHTCIDTSGATFSRNNLDKFDELLKYTDIVILDIKHIDNDEHIKLTGSSNTNILDFALYLSEKNIPLWIRHVAVPGITYNEDYLIKLGEFLAKLKSLKSLDVLPYHTMGVSKYKEMGLEYKLKNVPALPKENAKNAKSFILYGMKKALSEKNK
ncbi:MAG: pyruvate formate-lyase-activating protein [Lachnospirales bacterium]